jgi:type IV pilus assembly protein PilB
MQKTDTEEVAPGVPSTPVKEEIEDYGGDLVSGPVMQARKSFLDLLTENLSWRTIRDVLAYDVNRPLNDRSMIDLVDVALEDGLISKEQHRELRNEEDRAQESLGRIMLKRGMITSEQLKEAVDFRNRTGQPMWRTFMQLKMAMPESIMEILSSDIRIPFTTTPDSEFSQYLVDHKIIARKDLDDAWKAALDSNAEFNEYLVSNGLVSDDEITRAMAHKLGLSFDPMDELPEISPQLLNMIPPSILQRIGAIPFKPEGDKLHVAFADARNIQELDKLGLMLQMEMLPVLVPRKKLDELMEKNLPVSDLLYYTRSAESSDEEAGEEIRPAVEMLNVILRGLINCNGTDIHIEPFRDSTRIRFRVDGLLHNFISINPEVSREMTARIKTLAGMDVTKRFVPQDGHLNIEVDSTLRNFRIATVPCTHGEKVALRSVQLDIAFSTFEALGMTGSQRRVMNSMLNLPNGLILITGPVGSGKTTSLYACLNSLDCFRYNIMSVEDPVEFEVPGITQTQVNRKQDLTFATGIRALLRQDPDMIIIGEIRDNETAQSATRASLTGTLVLASLHANSAPSAVAALLQLGISPYMVGNSVVAVVFQRLVRKVCTQCCETREAEPQEKEFLDIDPKESVKLNHGVGCQFCLHTGYHGRTAVFELLEINDEYRRIIYTNPSGIELHQAAEGAGMLALHRHARDLVINGTTTIDEMLRIL